jgi:hypothetical protein
VILVIHKMKINLSILVTALFGGTANTTSAIL